MTHTPVKLTLEDMWRTVETYLAAIESSNWEKVGQCFSEDAFYSHPVYGSVDLSNPIEVLGRDAIVTTLSQGRRERTWVHEVESFIASDNKSFIETTVREWAGGPIRSRSGAVGRFNDKGQLTRWVVYRTGSRAD